MYQIIRVLSEGISIRSHGEVFFDKELATLFPDFIQLMTQILNAKSDIHIETEYNFGREGLATITDHLTKIIDCFQRANLIIKDVVREYTTLLLQIMQKYLYADSGYIEFLLEKAFSKDEMAKIWADLVNNYITAFHDENTSRGYFNSLALDSMRDDDFSIYRKLLPKGIKILEPMTKNWTDIQYNDFVEYFVYYALSEEEDRIKFIAKSKERKALIDMILNSNRNLEKTEDLKSLLIKVEEAKKPKPKKVIKEKGVVFEDVNFKRCVIEELMYAGGWIKPAFDIYEFAKNHLEREINIEDEGYDFIPEAQQFFEELPLTADLLAKVEEISFQLGGSSIAHNLIPFWDGEDDVFDVNYFEDFKHLPNLKTVYDGDNVDDEIMEELKAKGVKFE